MQNTWDRVVSIHPANAAPSGTKEMQVKLTTQGVDKYLLQTHPRLINTSFFPLHFI